MVSAIVYTSNSGYTKEYAMLLGKEIGVPVYDLKKALKELPGCSEIIYLGWLMAGKIKGLKKALNNYEVRVICGVGMGRNGSQIEDIRKRNIILEGLPLFTLQGGFDFSKVHGLNKFLMKMMYKFVSKKLKSQDTITDEEQEMLDMMEKGGSFVSIENLQEVLNYLKKIKK